MSIISSYVFVYNKGYQDTDGVESSVVTKIKGLIKTKPPHPLGAEIWDSVDVVNPAQVSEAPSESDGAFKLNQYSVRAKLCASKIYVRHQAHPKFSKTSD